MNEVRKWLQAHKEEKYRDFSLKLMSTKYEVLGVRIPLLRKYAKELCKKYGLEVTKKIENNTFEEIMLQGFVIAYSTQLIELKDSYIHDYLLKCDNWSLVDSFACSLKPKGLEHYLFYSSLENWREDCNEYVKRFVLVYSMNYLDDCHIEDILEYSSHLKGETRAVEMANAWLLATASISYFDKVYAILKNLDENTLRYYKGKIHDSYRINDINKEIVKKYDQGNC